jgi:hypothetical protein
MKKEIIVALIFILGLNGCNSILSTAPFNGYSTAIYAEKKSKSGYTKIKKVVDSRCGCSDAIAEYYVGNSIIYRFYYGCALFNTKKEFYTYCSRGAVIGPRIYEGTEEVLPDYEIRLSKWDRFVLHKIDSFIRTENQELGAYKLCEKRINGFKLVASH